MRKRGNNEGSIYRRGDGRWEAKVTVGYSPDGKLIRKSSYHKTRAEAQEEVRKKRNLLAKGIVLAEENKTLKEWSELWHKSKKAELSPATWENYGHILKIILPTLGHFRLKDIKHLQLQQFMYDVALKDGEPRSQSTMEKLRCVLHSMFKEAEKNELVIKNMASGLKLPKSATPRKEKEAFTGDEVAVIESHAAEVPFLDTVMVLINTGLQEGELLALLPRNIDREKCCIHVTNAMTRVNGSPTLGSTKTPESVRTIPVTPEIMRLIEPRIRGENDYLFTNRVEGLMMNPRTLLKHYKKALDTVGVRYLPPHCCRHTFATHLFMAGVNPKIVQKLMGHTDYALTANVYTHVNQNDLRDGIIQMTATMKK